MSDAPLPVEVVCTEGTLPVIAGGVGMWLDDTHIQVDLASAQPALQLGTRAIVNFRDGGSDRVIARIESIDGARIVLMGQRSSARERRVFPRLHAGLPLRYVLLRGGGFDDASKNWIADGSVPDGADWSTPDEFMNFSVTGLRFDAHEELLADDLLLLELGVRGRNVRWRCTGRVIRTFEIDEADKAHADIVHAVAVNFEHLPEEAAAALSNITLDIQDALL